MNSIRDYLLATQEALGRVAEESIAHTVSLLLGAWKRQKHIFILGNGGSASTASHMANDLSKATIVEGRRRVKAIALTDCVPLMTAWANDSSYDQVFREQLANLLSEGDVVIGISASGNSPNVLNAMEFARRNGAVTIGWTGLSGGKLRGMADHCVQVPTDDVGMIEGIHLILDHLVAQELRTRIQNEEELPAVP
jgi:D-sedoheptulose 7-phosphate isomerase